MGQMSPFLDLLANFFLVAKLSVIPWISLLITLLVSSFPKKKPRREDSRNTDNTNVSARHGYRDSRHKQMQSENDAVLPTNQPRPVM